MSSTLAGSTELHSFTKEHPLHTPLSSVEFLYDITPSPDLMSVLYSPWDHVMTREEV